MTLEPCTGWRLADGRHDRDDLNCLEQSVSRYLDVEDTAGETQEGSEGIVIGKWKKRKYCYVVIFFFNLIIQSYFVFPLSTLQCHNILFGTVLLNYYFAQDFYMNIS